MDRSSKAPIFADLEKKIVILTGPRQSGKTTLARSLHTEHAYFNYDDPAHRLALRARDWDRAAQLVVFDELHKMSDWESWVKGIYDTEGVRPRLLVTGSAQLETRRKVGDSLAGRFFHHRLHPLDLKELAQPKQARRDLVTLFECGGFPEPFLAGKVAFHRRWRRSHLDVILRHDLLDLETLRDIPSIETLVELLRRRVGSTVSYASLARDLERDPKTVRRWLDALERLYVVFRVAPWSKKVARSLLKEPKYYFYDCGLVEGDRGAKLENAVACALLKDIHRLEDESGRRAALTFLRDKDGREIDFCVVLEGQPALLVETKAADASASRHFQHYRGALGELPAIQLVLDLDRPRDLPVGPKIRDAAHWLARLDLGGYLK